MSVALMNPSTSARMRILFLTHYYPPEVNAPANRVSELAREWTHAGHEVAVVTCAPNHPYGKLQPPYRNRLFQRENFDGVEVIRVWTYLASNEGFFQRILNYLSFLISVSAQVRRLPAADIVISTSPQFFCGLAGFIIARVKRAPWVLEIRDLWPESIVTVGAMRRSVLIRLLEKIESWNYRTADHIVSVTKSFTPHFIERGADQGKISVITNGVDLKAFENAPDAEAFRHMHELRGKFVASYVGTHGMAHRLETSLEAAELTRDDPRIAFLMVGAGAERDRLIALKTQKSLDNVVMLPQMPRTAMKNVWGASDVSLVLLKDDPLFRKVIPSKIFEAMAMRCPIILGVEGEAKEIVVDGRCGIAIRPGNAGDLATALRQLAADPDLGAQLGANGRRLVVEHYDRRKLAADYLAILQETAQMNGRARPPPFHGSANLAARIVFAWHVPLRQALRRLYLASKRRVLERLEPTELRAPEDIQPSSAPPLPIFSARLGALACFDGDGIPIFAESASQPGKGAPRSDQLLKTSQSSAASTKSDSPSAERAPSPRRAGFRLTFLHRTCDLPSPIAWRIASADRRAQLWSMHLHYMEYLEEASDADFTRLVEDWLDANRPYGPHYWHDVWNSYAISLRTVVWMQQWAARTSLDPDLRARMAHSIAGQIAFLAGNLETDIGGNHLVKNAKALIWASSFFVGRTARRWRRHGVHLLQRILDNQILPDGLHYERSLSYHAQVFADLLECSYVLGPGAIGARLDAALKSMAQAIADLTHPDGRPPLFNDAGLHMAYAPSECLSGYEKLTGTRPGPRPSAIYAKAGYFCLRSGVDFLMVDCGPIAPDALPAHGHGDVLSFEWSVDGRRIIVDPGVFEYVAGGRRMLSRSCRSHNTVTLDALDQAEFFSDFRVGRRPHATVRRLETGDGTILIEGAHDGFARAAGRPVHVRSFYARRNRVSIRDRFEGTPRGTARAGLLLHPDIVAEQNGAKVLLSTDGLQIELRANRPASLADAAWWPDLGMEIATKRIEFTFPADGALTVDLIVRARPGSIPPSGISPPNRQSAKPLNPMSTKSGEGHNGANPRGTNSARRPCSSGTVVIQH
jgi:glycosyltransferase involved in cell wall biosynthesis/uncharacterized heparinase superfamily protein